jgi:hypothetical protein
MLQCMGHEARAALGRHGMERDLAPAADERLELFDEMERRVQRIRPLLAVDRLACAHAVRQLAVTRTAQEGGALSRWRLDIRSRRA